MLTGIESNYSGQDDRTERNRADRFQGVEAIRPAQDCRASGVTRNRSEARLAVSVENSLINK